MNLVLQYIQLVPRELQTALLLYFTSAMRDLYFETADHQLTIQKMKYLESLLFVGDLNMLVEEYVVVDGLEFAGSREMQSRKRVQRRQRSQRQRQRRLQRVQKCQRHRSLDHGSEIDRCNTLHI